MAVPPNIGTSSTQSSWEQELDDERSPRVPKPLPERGRRPSTPTLVLLLSLLVIVALIVLL